MRHGTRHVADGVVHDTVQFEDRLVVRGFAGGGNATTLVDGNVDDDCTRLHLPDEVLAHDDGGTAACNQYGTDDEVGLHDRSLNRSLV